MLSLSVGSAWAQDDAFMTEAKAYIETVTAPVTEWTGPTTGPKAQPDKLVIYVSDDQRNGGAQGRRRRRRGSGQGDRLGVPPPRRPGRGPRRALRR